MRSFLKTLFVLILSIACIFLGLEMSQNGLLLSAPQWLVYVVSGAVILISIFMLTRLEYAQPKEKEKPHKKKHKKKSNEDEDEEDE